MSDPFNRKQMEEMLSLLLSHQEMLEASMKPLSELLFSKFRSLVEAGFTRDEAMEIIRTRGLNA